MWSMLKDMKTVKELIQILTFNEVRDYISMLRCIGTGIW